MNPLVSNVPAAFVRVPIRPRAIAIDRKGVVLPTGGHFQGIQRLGTQILITSSSNTVAYCVLCEEGRAKPPLILGELPMKHAGGCQMAGSILAVGVEDDRARNRSDIQFWDFRRTPAQLTGLTIRRMGPEKVSTAGAVGLTSNGIGAVLAVGTWDCDTIDFYAAPTVPFTEFKLLRTWTKVGADRSDWIDREAGSYQSVNLLTQGDGKLFLIGFHRSGDADWMDLYSVDLQAAPAAMLRKIDKKQMYCTNGCKFRDGAGVYIPSSSRLGVYAVNGVSSDSESRSTIQVNYFL